MLSRFAKSLPHAVPEGSRDISIKRLREDLVHRRIGSGMGWLEAQRERFQQGDSADPVPPALVWYLAQWVDIGFGDPALVKALLDRFPIEMRAQLPLSDYVHLRMAEGMVAMLEEQPDGAIRHFELVLLLGEELNDRELLSIAYFWKARCHRQKGEYDRALSYSVTARTLAAELGHDRVAAVSKVLESWLVFQKGRLKEAVDILREAEETLRDTDDYVTLGNIQSGYGRIARREARYDLALKHFARAIEEYRKRDPQHRNLARSLVNMAYVKRLIAVRLRRKIDAHVARRRGSHERDSVIPIGPTDREALEQLRQEALAHLRQAEAIYRHLHHHRGTGSIHINAGYLFLDNGELDRAAEEGAQAYLLAVERTDYILMARARVIQCMAENAKCEEGIEDGQDPGRHAQFAQEFAREAVECARHTQNRRLQARAYICQGLTLSNEYFHNPEAARQSCDQATMLLKTDPRDSLWEELQSLRTRILRAGSVDATLRAWSQGAVGDKSFQQITEQFAELVIPKVWESEGKKVSRVAERLSISPKKVRRILDRLGLR
jgi:tetratricopeptide (TPR) repeat protein